MNSNLGITHWDTMRTKIRVSIYGVVTTPSCLNTSGIHWEISGCKKIVQMTSTERDL